MQPEPRADQEYWTIHGHDLGCPALADGDPDECTCPERDDQYAYAYEEDDDDEY